MELIPYLITFATGFASGIWLESRYGVKASQINAELHQKIDDIKSAVIK
jgi:hypothetical protein